MQCGSNLDDIESIVPVPRNLFKDQDLMKTVVLNMIKTEIKDQKEMDKFIRQEQRRIHQTIAHNQLLYTYRVMVKNKEITRNKHYEQFLVFKTVRSLSGICQITVFTGPGFKTLEDGEEFNRDPHYASERVKKLAKDFKNYSCPFDCFYCPNQPGMVRSYLKTEPGVMRAAENDFDPILQFRDRARTMIINGMEAVKIELNVKGGTFTEYDDDYRFDFITRLYYAANTLYDKNFDTNPRPIKTLEEEIKINETALCGIIGLTVEARPDSIKPQELINFRRMGITRYEMGIQTIHDSVLKYVNRGCRHKHAVKAAKLLLDNCIKYDIHIMYDLVTSTPEMDREMLYYLLNSPDLQADQWKLYPTTVVPWTKIETWYNNYKRGYDTEKNPENLSKVDNRIYKPYAEEILPDIKIKHGKTEIYSSPLIELLIETLSNIHPWIRINRVIRDIPGSHYVLQENYREDMRQIIEKEIKSRGLKCRDIRSRELKNKNVDVSIAKLFVRQYEASGGTEYFISYETPDEETIFGFLRLRISKDAGSVFPELKNTGLIRELHVYGKVIPVNEKNNQNNKAQHQGFGKKLIKKAEEITLHNGLTRIAVIAGVGVRNYYRKQGFFDHPGLGNFQIKTLTKPYTMFSTIMVSALFFAWLAIIVGFVHYVL